MAVVFDGELFTPDVVRQQLKQQGHVLNGPSDAEIALHAFEESGIQGIAGLAGAFAGLIYDSRTGQCHLFTDRLGLRSSYYHVTPEGAFIFASEMKAVVAASRLCGSLDHQAVAEFMCSGYLFFDHTFFQHVRLLLPGSVITFQGGKLVLNRYWDMPRVPPDKKWGFNDAVREAGELLIRAADRQIRQSGRLGVMLSGGLDSRAVAASVVGAGGKPVTFSLGSGDNVDQKLAVRVAERLGVENRTLQIYPDYLARYGELGMWYTDGMLPCSHLHWMSQLKYIEKSVDSMMTGYLGDILFAGVYLPPRHLREGSPNDQRNYLLTTLFGTSVPFAFRALRPNFLTRVKGGLSKSRGEIIDALGTRGFDNECDRLRFLGQENRYTHIVSSLLSVVADVKYLFGDYELLDFYTRVPAEWRASGKLYRTVLCHSFPKLLDIPCISASTKFIPARLDSQPSGFRIKWDEYSKKALYYLYRLTRGKISFPDRRTYVHYAHWYQTVPALRNWVRSILLDERTLDRGYYERAGVQELLHIQKTRGYVFDVLARLVTFEYWCRFFIDREPPQYTLESIENE